MARKNMKYAAACLTGGILLAAMSMSQAAVAEEEKKPITLSIAGEEDAETGASLEGEKGNKPRERKKPEDKKAAENEEGTDETVGLALAEPEEETEAAAEEMEEEQTEAVVYETLETTATGSEGIIALDVSGIVESCMPSIVAITNRTVQEVEDYFYGSKEIETNSTGSGIIIAQNDTELLIVTNRHVVADAKETTVCFTLDSENPEELVVPAVTKGSDKDYDLAVIAVNLKDIPEHVLSRLRIATLGSSDDLKVGETAIVIGNALGIGQTVTSGIVSALEKEVKTTVGNFTEFQTDAAINFGCSGGAVLNNRGEVIGIASAKMTGTSVESMGYAIPIDSAIPVLKNLINRETRAVVEKHGYLGITVVPVSQEAIEMYNMPAGAFVYGVNEGSAAEAAGIRKGDIITGFDGIKIDSADTLVETLTHYSVGETCQMEVQSAEGGSYVVKELEITLQEGTEEEEETEETSETAASEEPAVPEEEPEKDLEEYDGVQPFWFDGDDDQGKARDFFDFFFGDGAEDGVF